MPVEPGARNLTLDQQILLPDEAGAGPVLRPLFRWPGGKRWLLPYLLKLVPASFDGRYFEPFFGGGALFFALTPGHAVLSDRNAELMDAYRVTRDRPADLEEALRCLPRGSDAFYRIRATSPAEPVLRAARLIYLTSNGFNGIYRVNQRGQFNVPYGERTYDRLGEHGSLASHSRVLRKARILDADFAQALRGARAGDLAYLDPPYAVAHSHNGFRKYNAKVFSWEDQERLARIALDLADRGVRVIVSNAEHESIARLYEAFTPLLVARKSLMAPNATQRITINEVIYTTHVTGGRRSE